MELDELRMLITRHVRPDMSTPIDGVMIASQEDVESQPSMSGAVMALIVQGGKRIALGKRVYEYRAGQYLVASIDLPITGQYLDASREKPALGFGLTLEPTRIAELLLQAPAASLPVAGGYSGTSMIVANASRQLLDAITRLLRLLDQPRDIAVLAPMIKREILWWLIVGEQGAAVRQLGLADSHLNHVARAVRWIRDHYTEAFRVEDVAAFVGMSVSTFYRNFQAATAMSPIQFQKQIRLQQARLLLAAYPGDVTGTGFRVGYESASQFSREYRRQFGSAPSQDAATLSLRKGEQAHG
jgi:AraC-like DNA-binding protein